jgi:hypothetical protein
MPELNGGVTAPAPSIGLASVRRPRSVNRRQTPRGKKIQQSVAEQQQARSVRRSGGVTAPPPSSPAGSGALPAVGPAVNTKLGAQLSGRVSSGAIDQQQAEQVAHDRALLEEHYGPDWRDKVFGGAGRVQRLRKSISEKGPGEFGAKARLGQLLAKRNRMLEQAKGAG